MTINNAKNVSKAELVFLLVSGLINRVNLSDMPALGDEIKGGEDKFLKDGYHDDQTSFVQSVEMTADLFSNVNFVYRVTDTPASRKHKADLKQWIDLFAGFDRDELKEIAIEHFRVHQVKQVTSRAMEHLAFLTNDDESTIRFWIDGYCRSAKDLNALNEKEFTKLHDSLVSKFIQKK